MQTFIAVLLLYCFNDVSSAILTNDTISTRTFNKFLGYTLSKFSGSTAQFNGLPVIVIPYNAPAPSVAQNFQNPLPTLPVFSSQNDNTSSGPVFSSGPLVGTLSPETVSFPNFATEDNSQNRQQLPSPTIGPPPSSLEEPTGSVATLPPFPFPTSPPLPPATSSILPLPSFEENQPTATTSSASPMSTGLTGFFQASDLQNIAQGINIPPTTNFNGLQQCSCVPAGTCVSSSVIGGRIDLRIVTQNPGVACPAGTQYCCTQGTNQLIQSSCGTQNILPGVTPMTGQANFGEFPWSGIIVNSANQYVGGAALIGTTHLLTAAHVVANYGNGAGLRIRLGEWDFTAAYEPFNFVDIPVLNIVTHPGFVASTLQNDLAVITLTSAVNFLTNPTPQINSVCLPTATDVFAGRRCHVAGWGRDSFNGNYQNIMKRVDVAVLGNLDCQQRLQRTRLGPAWQLDTTSFICAGGELNKDACTGDGGNALVCQVGGRFVVAGITAGGVECGLEGVPGLYVNVINYLNWIQSQAPNTNGNFGGLDPRRGG